MTRRAWVAAALLHVAAVAPCPSASAQVDPAAAVAVEASFVNERLASGVPLGGIGCGRIELRTDATFGAFTGNTNWDRPVAELPASFFALRFTDAGGRVTVRALSGGDPAGLRSVERIEFDGRFPVADVLFDDPSLPVRVKMRALAPFTPGDAEGSAIPGVLLRFDATLAAGARGTVELVFAFENVSGVGGDATRELADRTGTFARPFERGTVAGVLFGSESAADGFARNVRSTLAIAVRDAAPVLRPGVFDALAAAGGGGEVRGFLERAGALRPFDARGVEGKLHVASLLIATFDFGADRTARIDAALAWHAPHHVLPKEGIDRGKAYGRRFAAADEVAAALLKDPDALERRTTSLERALRRSTLPEWLVRQLLDGLAPMASGTVWTADGHFACIESPEDMGGALGTLDQRLASHVAWTAMFPQLDRRELETFAALQTPAGQLPHFTGNLAEALEDATVAYGLTDWPDLAASFVLQVDAHARWTGDREFLDACAPRVLRALSFLHQRDRDGDGIPEGGSTFDERHYPGAFVYTGSVVLAALRAGERIARASGKDAFAATCAERFGRAQRSFVTSLWNGRYFDKVHDPASGFHAGSCFLGQLAGDFRARLVGLGPIVEPALARRAMQSLLELNAAPRFAIPALEVEADGREAWTTTAWAPYVAAHLAAPAIRLGQVDGALDVLERIARARRFSDRDPFDPALIHDATSGRRRWGDAYMSATAVWAVPLALLGADMDLLDGGMLALDPRLPARWTIGRLPLFLPRLHALVEIEGNLPTRFTIEVLETSPGCRIDRLELGVPTGSDAASLRLLVPADDLELQPASGSVQPGCARFDLPHPVDLGAGTTFEVVLVSDGAAAAAVDPRSARGRVGDAEARGLEGRLEVRGDPFADPLPRLLWTEQCTGVRAVLDSVELDLPAGVRLARASVPPYLRGETLAPGRARERDLFVEVDPDLRGRRVRVGLEVRGHFLDATRTPFSARRETSVGHAFVTAFAVRGPLPPGDRPRDGGSEAPAEFADAGAWPVVATTAHGLLDLRGATAAGEAVATWLVALDIHCDAEREAQVVIGSGAAVQVWMNARSTAYEPASGLIAPAQLVVPVRLQPGVNALWLELSGARSQLPLFVEVLDADLVSDSRVRVTPAGR